MNFDQDQKQVVNHVNGAMLVVAGAGSGKTATIIGRAARLINELHIPPENHLMLTFSRKAADEMKARLRLAVPYVSLSKMVIGTFHSFGYQLIRDRPITCGRRSGVTIMDEKNAKRMIKSILSTIDMNVEEDESKLILKNMMTCYSLCCNDLLDISNNSHGSMVDAVLEKNGIYFRHIKNAFFEIFTEYARRKSISNVLDFEDLLTLPAFAFRDSKNGREWGLQLSQKYPYMTVDEAQDTSMAQYMMVKGITAHGNVVMVGDDDQSVYGWRGAQPGNMKNFRNSLNAEIVFLEKNYRSTQSIVSAASNHVAKNNNRFKKTSYAVKDGGNLIKFKRFANSMMAVKNLTDEIEMHVRRGGSWSDVVIMYRVNKISRLIERELLYRGFPYKIMGEMNFEQRKEIRIALALARLVINEFDAEALRTVCELIPGVGDVSMEKMIDASEDNGQGLLCQLSKVPKKTAAGLLNLSLIIERLKESGPEGLVQELISESGLNASYVFEKKDNKETATGRIRNLMMLHGMIRDWMRDEDSGWETIFDKILGSSGTQEVERPIITLTTIHRAKGLEFKVAHIFGYSEGLIPLIMDDENDGDDEELTDNECGLEEERRLSYVAITRAKESCTLWHCDLYDYGYEKKKHVPSRFLPELGLGASTFRGL